MLACPDDLQPCRRSGCNAGHCQRTGEDALTGCWECGVVVARRHVVVVCVECTSRYSHLVDEKA